MQSKLLNQHGLIHYIAGSTYNFRQQKIKTAVKESYERALEQINAPIDEVYSGTQVHGTQVAYADGQQGNPFLIGKNFPDTDGLITDKAGIALVIKYADCTPIVIYDPVRKVQASVHSGWRGTVKRISHAAIHKMQADFSSKLEDLVIFLGPSIDQANYEVGPEVYEAFEEFPTRDLFFKPQGEKFLLSMLQANYESLLELGLKPEQIDLATASTYTDPRLHSARQEKADYGLNAIITLIPRD